MSLGIRAIRVDQPEAISQNSLLGESIPSIYRHLYDEAGNKSRPSSVRRGVSFQPTEPYMATSALVELRSCEMATQVADMMTRPIKKLKKQVTTVIHAQCTVDQQILSSTCLRLQNDHFINSQYTLSVGQVGTVGVGSAIELAKHRLRKDEGRLISISACDKWIAPYIRRYPTLVAYGDAAAACLIGKGNRQDCIAEVLATSIVAKPLGYEFYSVSPELHRENLINIATQSIKTLMTKVVDQKIEIDGLIGDCYELPVVKKIADQVHMYEKAVLPEKDVCHASSAEYLLSIVKALRETQCQSRAMNFIIWTASLSGHAAAMLIRCYPDCLMHSGTYLKAHTKVNAEF